MRCDPESELSNACSRVFGDGSARRLSAYNGGDVETKAGAQHIIRVMKETRPGLVWLSPECGPYSPMQHLNMKTEKQHQDLAEKRARARQQYKGCCEIAEEAYKENIPFIIELSEHVKDGVKPYFPFCMTGFLVCQGSAKDAKLDSGMNNGSSSGNVGSCWGRRRESYTT